VLNPEKKPDRSNCPSDETLKALAHGKQVGLVELIPHFLFLKLQNAREGYSVTTHIGQLKTFSQAMRASLLVISYHTGARKGEIRKIRKERIDLPNARIELTGKTTKNKKARYLPIYGETAEIKMAISSGDPKCPMLIQREGKPVLNFEKSWRTTPAN
jgi:integrase